MPSLGVGASADAPAEPSGLGMPPSEASKVDPGPHFESDHSQWCDMSIDARGRSLEPTPSLLQAWNLVASRGQPRLGDGTSLLSEDDARQQICGQPGCAVRSPQVIRASADDKVGLGVLIPDHDGLLIVPIAGGVSGECREQPRVEVEVVGELMHVSTIAEDGDYLRYHFHGEFDYSYGYAAGEMLGGCQITSATRTDLIVDISTGELELTLIQVAAGAEVPDAVQVELDEGGVKLEGCGAVLELAWTDPR